jgi:hypothetical protein
MQWRSIMFPGFSHRAIRGVVAACLLAGCHFADAQMPSTALTPEQSAMVDQLVGDWRIPRGNTPLPEGLKAEYPYAELEKVSTAHLQPWAKAKQEATEWDIDDTGAVCKRSGPFRQGFDTGGAIMFVRGHDKLVWLANVDQMNAIDVFINSPHPGDLLPTWNGDWRAHFEGNIFVIDSIGFNDKSWLGSDRQAHTEELHVIQYITLHDNGNYIEDRVIIDDRQALTTPYSFIRIYKKQPATPAPAAMAGGGGFGQGGGGEQVCNQERIGKDPWRRKREGLIADHQEELDAYIKEVTTKK